MTTVNIETLLRRMPLGEMISSDAQAVVDELLSKKTEPLSPEFRGRLVAAAERALRARREILTLAAFASGHRPNQNDFCRECRKDWPCPDVRRAAGPALDALVKLEA